MPAGFFMREFILFTAIGATWNSFGDFNFRMLKTNCTHAFSYR